MGVDPIDKGEAVSTEPASRPTRASETLALAHAQISRAHLLPEADALERLIALARHSVPESVAITAETEALIEAVRANGAKPSLFEALMREYRLSSEEGVLLLCLAEALLRVPDAATADRLIGDKVGPGDWAAHLGHSSSFLVNASTFGLLLTGRFVTLDRATQGDPPGAIRRFFARAGEPLVRTALLSAVRVMAREFVFGRTVKEAIRRAGQGRYSFDMLGEAARTADDAERYRAAYAAAIAAITARKLVDAGISVKLSALHPRFEWKKPRRLMQDLVPRLEALAAQAAEAGLQVTIDAEEADRLEITLAVFEAVARAPGLKGWNGLGFAVQAYQTRAPAVIEWAAALAHDTGRRVPIRLVKGAYWDTEIKRAQVQGLSGYPVFTRKSATDTAYLACARLLLADPKAFAPQFATHNPHTIAAIWSFAQGLGEEARRDIEFQRLHGMGEALYRAAQTRYGEGLLVRVYAPVGGHEDLLAYLVRRLLENGANNGVVSQLGDPTVDIARLAADPVETIAAHEPKAHPAIPLPGALYGADRVNAAGLALDNGHVLQMLQADIGAARREPTEAAPLVAGEAREGEARPVQEPADHARSTGSVIEAGARDIEAALQVTAAAADFWNARGGAARADILAHASDLLEQRRAVFLALLISEGGKTLVNGLSEIREAVDALRYYAAEARRHFAAPLLLPGPVGERNSLALHGRGVFACISPWNFPLAIFMGQVAAALAAGNAVVAKPAEQTPLVGYHAVKLLHEAGVPAAALAFLPGGPAVGAALTSDPRIAGIAFTGSTDTARLINRSLAARPGPIVPLIAETGGLNALIADSTALAEQVVDDCIAGAFDSAGQRCSATRILFVQEEASERVIRLLRGAIAELAVGDPFDIETDVGPLIDADAKAHLEAHAVRMARAGTLIAEAALGPGTARGTFFAPRAYVLDSLSPLEGEVFGPILHVVRYGAHHLEAVCDAINATGYGLTLSVHSRIERTVETVQRRVRVGNAYINRNQIGAVIGVQPFGGEELSGTGPKAGGPHYLPRFALERAVSVNTAAAGGDTRLLSLE